MSKIFIFVFIAIFYLNGNLVQAEQLSNSSSQHYEQKSEITTYNSNRPIWAEFCPIEYINAEFNNKKIVPYYKRIDKWENNYWVNRRDFFEKELANCDSITEITSRDMCYTKLRDIQYNQNVNFQANKYQKLQDRAMQDAFGYGMMLKQTPQNVNVNIDGTIRHSL